MSEYPRHWEADVLLRDGQTGHLRPIVPADRQGLVEFYSRVSAESKYRRFFAPMPVLSERDLQRFVEVDHHDRVALVLTVAERIVAVGRFDRLPGTDEAEVAFLVEDAHQGRGIAQLLLEHLAQAGRERGVARFVADVLPENHIMIQVFRDAGYQVAGDYEDGVLGMEFPIEPTESAVGVMVAREHRAEAASIRLFFEATGVAVIGASRRHDTIGQTLVRNLVTGDYQGRVYVVNPAAEAVAGMPAYPSVQAIPDRVDVAIIAVPAEAVPDVVVDCAAKGVHGLVVISSGFAESGAPGMADQRRLLELARSYGLRLIGPNCLGIINTALDQRLNASLAPAMPPRGRVGFFCQSGALGVAILEKVARRGLGLSTFVSAGNRADVSGNDLLQFWEEDADTEVVLLYLESIGNPRKFSRIARRVSRVKPVVVVRSGRTLPGVPMGHPAPAPGVSPAAVDAMFRQAGVLQVDTLDEMFDVAELVAHQPLPAGNRVAVVGNSDALSLLAADAASAVGLEIQSQAALGADATAEDFQDALDAAIDDPAVDSVVAVYIPPLNTSGAGVAHVLAAVGWESDKPVVSTFLGAEGVPEPLRVPDEAGSAAGRGSVPSYPAVESAVRALARVVEYAAWLAEPEGLPVPPEEVDLPGARAVVDRVLAADPSRRDLSFEELRALLAAYGVDLWQTLPVDSEDAAVAAGAELGWDVVLKASAERLRQRPDLAHVWRSIDSEAQMRHAWTTMQSMIDGAGTAGFVVQHNAPPGIPVSIGGIEDPVFGPVVSFGISGIASELLGDRSYRIPPMHSGDVAAMVREIRAAPLLFGYRGSERVDTDAVEDLLLRVAQLKSDLPEVHSLELNLILVGAQGASVLNAVAGVERAADARSDWFARRMASAVAAEADRPVLRDTLSR